MARARGREPAGAVARPTRLEGSDAYAVVDVLCDAFAGYPVMEYVLGDAPEAERGPEPHDRLRRLIHFFVSARVLREEPVLALEVDEEIAAAAILTAPDGRESPPELGELREEVWRELGPEARARYEAFGGACAQFTIPGPHFHLNMIGVRRRAHGRGLARVLLDEVHRMSADDPLSRGVSLTTEVRGNVPLYEHFGYRVIGHARVAESLESWSMFRPDDG